MACEAAHELTGNPSFVEVSFDDGKPSVPGKTKHAPFTTLQ